MERRHKPDRLVAISLIRELGPVLCALMVTGRVGSAIAAELGSMTASQQIDAMRALGTDPIKKLVAPRLVALVITLPLLTVVADVVGIAGGGIAATLLYGLSIDAFVSSVRDGITGDDIIGGVIKPFCFAIIIASVACYKGLTTEGGTVGVGRSTTRAVVTASIVVIITDFFVARALQYYTGNADELTRTKTNVCLNIRVTTHLVVRAGEPECPGLDLRPRGRQPSHHTGD